MRILFLSWRDIKNPRAGGAENFTHEMLKRLVQKGFKIEHFSCSFEGGLSEEILEGVRYIRGNKNPIKVIFEARQYYRQNGPYDWVVDQRNTHHFFTFLWLPKSQRRALFIHQTTRELWYSEMPWPIAILGHLHELATLRFTNCYPTFTASESTSQELIRDFGYREENTVAFHQGLNNPPSFPNSHLGMPKSEVPTFIYVGRFSTYKGIDIALEAFALFFQKHQKGNMYIVGKKNEHFEQKIWSGLKKKYPFLEAQVEITGFISSEKRDHLMSISHAILVPSQREGWGLIITEANAQGTIAIVSPNPGIQEAVGYGETGIITDSRTPEAFEAKMTHLIEHPEHRKNLEEKAYAWATTFTWDIAGDQAEKFFKER